MGITTGASAWHVWKRIEKNWADHERINRNIEGLHASMTAQKENIDKLLVALRELIDRIPPENLRP
jgi:hypothetical protein